MRDSLRQNLTLQIIGPSKGAGAQNVYSVRAGLLAEPTRAQAAGGRLCHLHCGVCNGPHHGVTQHCFVDHFGLRIERLCWQHRLLGFPIA